MSLNNRILAAALTALAVPVLSSVPDIRMPAPMGGAGDAPPWPRAHTRMRVRTRGSHKPAGSKLWRKASEQKLGLRW
jgi:hypothetical protein